jgi:hypothetical protein
MVRKCQEALKKMAVQAPQGRKNQNVFDGLLRESSLHQAEWRPAHSPERLPRIGSAARQANLFADPKQGVSLQTRNKPGDAMVRASVFQANAYHRFVVLIGQLNFDRRGSPGEYRILNPTPCF